jgi:hypothetical protein
VILSLNTPFLGVFGLQEDSNFDSLFLPQKGVTFCTTIRANIAPVVVHFRPKSPAPKMPLTHFGLTVFSLTPWSATISTRLDRESLFLGDTAGGRCGTRFSAARRRFHRAHCNAGFEVQAIRITQQLFDAHL